MSAIGRIKNLVFIIAVVMFTALFAVFIGATDVIARAEDDGYLINLSSSSVVYNGKAIVPIVTVTYNGEAYGDFTATYFKDGEAIDEIKDVGTYSVKVSINDSDPIVERELAFKVDPKPLKIVLGGSNEFLYSGMGYARNVSPLGICDNDECEIITTYRGKIDVLEPGELPINADSYTMFFETSNPNYVVGEIEGEADLTITKRNLYVTVNDTQVTHGGTPEFSYEIIGFVGKEDESVIEKMPVVRTNADSVGVHNINASGGQARNYEFKYTAGHLTINDTKATGEIEGSATTFDVSGVFAPLTSYTGALIEGKSEEGKELIKTARDYRMLNFTSDIQLIYQISYAQGVQVSDKIDVVFHNVTLNSNDKYVIVVIDPNGVVTQITKYEYLNGTLSFKAPSLGTIMIFKDTYAMSVLYIIIACIVIFVVVLFIGAKMQYRNDKRQIEESKKRREVRERGKYKWTN